MSFQDGRHSILSLVCLALLCSVFKVRFPDIKSGFQYLNSCLNTEIQFQYSFGNFCLDEEWCEALYFYTRKHQRRSINKNLVGLNGLEPSTSRLSGGRSNLLSYKPVSFGSISSSHLSLGGDNRDRTDDPLLAKQVLSQLSYTPISSLLC